MKVWTFEQIGNVLKVAGDKKCQEAQACLEGMGTINFFFIYCLLFFSNSLYCGEGTWAEFVYSRF